MNSLNVARTYSIDVRSKNPSLYAKLIMWWSFRKSGIPKSKRWHHCAGVLVFDNKVFVYDADEKFHVTHFDEWVKNYHIVNISDTTKEYNLGPDARFKIWEKYNSWLGTSYGVTSIIGLIIHDITHLLSIGRDGVSKLICSESEMRMYGPYLPDFGDEPLDYFDPYERGLVFNMQEYVGQLDIYK